MIQEETIYRNQQPIGRIFANTKTGQIAFSPCDGINRLPDRDWQSVDQLKKALAEVYAHKT